MNASIPILNQKGKRSAVEVKIDVLRVLSLGVSSPTRIMYASNVSWLVLMKILEELLQKGLIEEREAGGRKKYVITENGREVLRKYDEVKKSLG